MPKFKPCPKDVTELAVDLIDRFETHAPLRVAGVKIDFVFAYADRDEDGQKKNCALTKGGMPALGICRKVAPKDRAQGRGDAEISLDGDWWDNADDEERAALLDHEMHHICVHMADEEKPQLDKQGRPQLSMRKHDVEVGWFNIIAQRHGKVSMERQQAKRLAERCGQYYWPELMLPVTEAEKPKAKGRQSLAIA